MKRNGQLKLIMKAAPLPNWSFPTDQEPRTFSEGGGSWPAGSLKSDLYLLIDNQWTRVRYNLVIRGFRRNAAGNRIPDKWMINIASKLIRIDIRLSLRRSHWAWEFWWNQPSLQTIVSNPTQLPQKSKPNKFSDIQSKYQMGVNILGFPGNKRITKYLARALQMVRLTKFWGTKAV